MSRTNNSEKQAYLTAGLMVGAAIGMIAGILTAPRSGKDTRTHIKENTNRAKMKAAEKLVKGRNKASDSANELIDSSRKEIRKAASETSARARRASDRAKADANGNTLDDLL